MSTTPGERAEAPSGASNASFTGLNIFSRPLRERSSHVRRLLRGREENLLSRRRAGAPSARQAQRCRTPPLPKPQLLRLDS